MGGVRQFLLSLLLLLASASAPRAEVTLTFYSHHLGVYRSDVVFPHAHIAVKGTAGPDHKPVKANFGFTAEETPPSILWEPVNGKIMSMPDDYITASKPHLSITISDEQYRTVLAVVDRWKKYPQPSYKLDTHNCVTFVQDVALALKLPASRSAKFARSPEAFLDDLQARVANTDRALAAARSRRPPLRQARHANAKAVRVEN